MELLLTKCGYLGGLLGTPLGIACAVVQGGGRDLGMER